MYPRHLVLRERSKISRSKARQFAVEPYLRASEDSPKTIRDWVKEFEIDYFQSVVPEHQQIESTMAGCCPNCKLYPKENPLT